MFRRSRRRLGLVLLLISSLLFQQVAVAAFACPGPGSTHASAAMEMSGKQHCAAMGMTPAPRPQPLCQQHCSPDQTVVTDTVAGNVPALALDAPVFATVLHGVTPERVHRLECSLARPSPPPRLRYCRLLL